MKNVVPKIYESEINDVDFDDLGRDGSDDL